MTNLTLQVEGMSCQHCVNSIEGALQAIGANGKVNLAAHTVEVTWTDGLLSLEAVKEAIEEQGYEVVAIIDNKEGVNGDAGDGNE
ncbi:cation transporter [Brevibacillus choshinensis]|uniref:Heavy-metal-associated domain-containing protein n=1 Tax=Brevibacillus choshinensis TaxID=54911 RepID=A0ABX7FLS7_BRECH|nr:cation transporter [Brevibacillus choshinensis]QRG67198.1 heavy-metal-associated domain-containing protein [Brevibacillus choshinensis]